MSISLTKQDQQFLDQLVTDGQFQDCNQALQAAVGCLRQAIGLDELLESRYAEVERGEVIAYDEQSLEARFEELRMRAKTAAARVDAP